MAMKITKEEFISFYTKAVEEVRGSVPDSFEIDCEWSAVDIIQNDPMATMSVEQYLEYLKSLLKRERGVVFFRGSVYPSEHTSDDAFPVLTDSLELCGFKIKTYLLSNERNALDAESFRAFLAYRKGKGQLPPAEYKILMDFLKSGRANNFDSIKREVGLEDF